MILSSRLQAKPAVLSRIQDKVSTWLGKAASRIEGRVPVFIAILLALYLWILKSERIKPLWHDELYTYYIAQAHTFSQMMTWIRTIDLNPPLYYIAARLVFHVVQPSKAAVRIPSIVAYFVAVISVYQLVRRRFTPLYGFIGALVLLGSSFNVYSYEARPYAMVLAFMGILSLGWQRAIEEDRSRSWIALLFVVVGGFGMLLSHVLALVAYAALLLTEFIRFLLCRKPDWILWICLLLPLSACVTYFGPIQNHDAGAFPAVYQASIVKLLSAYSDIWIGIASLFATGAVAIILLIPEKLPANNNKKYGFSLPEIILALGFAVSPW